ncbi:unnamed protein product [Taenia asiatica]|uniref:Uncharacterized protein n=1 Tax=Taenia asiatica TaxID=60517 RepID=A0A0R3VW06_TAEAS|nr:unnamed protein product [Taenia asiatica]
MFSTHRGEPAPLDEPKVSKKQWFVLSGGAVRQLSLPQELMRQCCQFAVCLLAITHEQSSRTKGAWRDASAALCDSVPSVLFNLLSRRCELYINCFTRGHLDVSV